MKVVVVFVMLFEQNCMLLIGDDGIVVVIDLGGDIECILVVVQQYGVCIEKILFMYGYVDYCVVVDVLCMQFGVFIEGLQKDEVFWID